MLYYYYSKLNNMGNVLITGGLGYIGSHTAVNLSENGYTPLSVDDLSNGHKLIGDGVSSIINGEYVNHNFDLKNRELTDKLFEEEDIDSVIHFAAFKSVGDSVKNPIGYYRNNIDSLLNVLEASINNGVKTFVFSSSCSVYGNPDELPVDENTPIKPGESPYAKTKQMCEEICLDVAKSNPDINIIILRYFNPVGAHESALIGDLQLKPQNLVPIITRCAINGSDDLIVNGFDYPTRDGSCIRDYVHVMDIASAHTKAIEFKSNSNYNIFNLGSGSGVSVLELISAFEDVTGNKINYKMGPRRDGDVVSVYSNSEKAFSELNWSLKYDVNDMMSTAWAWEESMRS